MPGLFNVENALGVIAVCHALHVPPAAVYDGLVRAGCPDGWRPTPTPTAASTPLWTTPTTACPSRPSSSPSGRSIPAGGSSPSSAARGTKAYDRRKDLGEISGKYADLVILTEEDAGEEPVEDICRDIAQYVEQQGCDYTIVPTGGRPSARR